MNQDCQLYNFKYCASEQILGVGEQHGGVGGMGSLQPSTDAFTVADIKNQPLGSVSQILFWNNSQREFLAAMKSERSIVLAGKLKILLGLLIY